MGQLGEENGSSSLGHQSAPQVFLPFSKSYTLKLGFLVVLDLAIQQQLRVTRVCTSLGLGARGAQVLGVAAESAPRLGSHLGHFLEHCPLSIDASFISMTTAADLI